DIAQVSPLKERKDSSDSEDDHPASEGKVTTGTEGAYEAQVFKGKEPVVADDIAAATPKRKRAGKGKVEDVVEKKKKKVATSVSKKEKVTKKKRTQKKKAPRVVRK
ncbi:hypothetical protein A2U01_0068239, partial [Trifolium medium]|nr:hypothetical protein [Trifolium medium]